MLGLYDYALAHRIHIPSPIASACLLPAEYFGGCRGAYSLFMQHYDESTIFLGGCHHAFDLQFYLY
jgi:hypothetical protein